MSRSHRFFLTLLLAGLVLTVSVGFSPAQEDPSQPTQNKDSPSKKPGTKALGTPKSPTPVPSDPFTEDEPSQPNKAEPGPGEKTQPVQAKIPEPPAGPEGKKEEPKKEEPAPTAASSGPSTADLKVIADTLWVLITAFLVFFMNLGFGCVEAGFCRAKNATNILGKNFVVFALSTLAFWIIGFGIMFGSGSAYFGTVDLFSASPDNSPQTASLSSLIKSDLKEKYKLDLDDEAIKKDKKYEKLIAAVDGAQTEAQSKITANTKKVKTPKGETEEAITFPVKLEVPDYPTFEKSYKAADFYWGTYSALNWTGVPLLAKFFFQLVFAGTAATIVSGCVAERIHYGSFMVFALFLVAISYPITGHWIWGGGWLATEGFFDFAGSTVVHTVGGVAGLAGILLLGPRLGKYKAKGAIQPIPGHSMGLAFIGGLVLWLGWFGFNPGSTMAADAKLIAHIVITTNMAAATGMVAATIVAWIVMGKPDFSMTVNGCLAGLVAITAPCAWVSPMSAAIIGAIGGVLVVFAVLFFDRIRIDDPVGALGVHMANGIWGTLAIGLFADPIAANYTTGPKPGLLFGGGMEQLIIQARGVATVAVFTFVGSLVVWAIIKYTIGMRVHEEDEIKGLDVSEMGMEAYSGFQVADPIEYTRASQEPRSATVPPGSSQRFTVVVSGVVNGELMQAWSDLCQPGKTIAPEFKAIYPYMTTVQGNRFNFRGGDPEMVRLALQTVFKGKLKGPIQTHVERY